MPPPRRRLADLLWLAALGLLALLVYGPALHGAFLWDDPAHITRLGLQSVDGLRRILFEVGATQEYYPVLHGAFWLEHRLWGEAPLPYHLLNVFLHATSGWLLALILRRLWSPGPGMRLVPAGAEWFAAALFVVHPVCVESVAWITEQKNTLSTCLYLLAALVYLNFSARRGRVAYVAALGLFALALGAKTATVTLPAALLVVRWWQQGRLDWGHDVRPLLPWFALALVAGLLTKSVEGNWVGANLVVPDLPLLQRVLLAARIFWFYLGKLLWPAELTFFYPLWNVAADSAGWILALVAGVAATVGLWLLRGRTRGPLAAWLLFGGTLFPVLGFFKVFAFSFSYVADHFQYLAIPVVMAAVAAGFFTALARWPKGPRLLAPVLAGIVVLGLAGVARGYSRLYTDNETLFRANLARNPSSWMGHRILAYEAGQNPARRDEAIALYRTAWRLQPDNADVPAALAALLVQQPGHREEAIQLFEAAVRLRPSFAEAHNGLANELVAVSGRELEAIAHYQTALQLRPRFALARLNLATALAAIPGRQEEALAALEEVLRDMPDSAPAHYRLANLLASLPGRQAEAISHYERALELDPGVAVVHYDLARRLAGSPDQLAAALAHTTEAVRLDPGFVEAYNLLGVLQVRAGRMDEARAAWQQALAIRPDFAPAQRNLRLLEQNSGR